MKKRKTKILLWAPKGAGTHYWGPGQNAFNMYRRIDKAAYEVHLAHGSRDQHSHSLYDSISFIFELKSRNALRQCIFILLSSIWVFKTKGRFDAVHVLTVHHIGFLPAVLFKIIHRVPVFIKIQSLGAGFGINSRLSKNTGFALLRRKLAGLVDGYIAISKGIYDELKDVGIPADKIFFIPNGVDSRRFKPVDMKEKKQIRNRLGIPDRFTILFTGSIHERKNPALIAEACTRLEGKWGDYNLLIAGPVRKNSPQIRKINELRAKCPQLEKNIQIVGFRKNIIDFYRASDLFILPSEKEGMSNSLLEALSCGLATLTTRISGSEDLIEDGKNGYFISRNAESIAERIQSYMAAGQSLIDRHALNARRTITNSYDSRRILDRYLSLFQKNRISIEIQRPE